MKYSEPFETDIPAMGIDLLPTFLAEVGVSLPTDRIIDGHDLFQIIDDTTGTGLSSTRPLFFFHDYSFEAVRIGNWKYLETNYSYTWPIPLQHPASFTNDFVGKYNSATGDTSVDRLDSWPKLFNLDENQSESYNLASRNAEQAKKMQNVLTEFRNEFLENPRGWK